MEDSENEIEAESYFYLLECFSHSHERQSKSGNKKSTQSISAVLFLLLRASSSE